MATLLHGGSRNFKSTSGHELIPILNSILRPSKKKFGAFALWSHHDNNSSATVNNRTTVKVYTQSSMDIVLKDFNSDISGSASRRSSTVDIAKCNDDSDKRDAPTHLFISPTHSDSILSSSSNSSGARERRRKITIEETSLFTHKKVEEKKKEWKKTYKVDINTVRSSPSNVERRSSSGTDETTCSSNRSKNTVDDVVQPLSDTGSNRVHDIQTNKESQNATVTKGDSRNRQICSASKSSVWDTSFDSETRRSETRTPSENISYREKIRDRFNTVKERAVESLSRPQSRSQSRLKMLMMKQTGLRYEDLLRKQEDELNAAIKRHETIRELWSDACQGVMEMANAHKESYNFFIGAYEDVSSKDTTLPEEMSPTNVAAENDSAGKIFTSELLGIKDDWEMCEYKMAELSDTSTAGNNEKIIFFTPSTKQVSLEQKLEAGLTPRYVEEEGIYAGKVMKLPAKVTNKMEQRLLMTPDGKKWFGMDGAITSTMCPLSCVRMRSHVPSENEQTTAITIYSPAVPTDRKNRCMDLAGNIHYVLDVDISLIQFSHHPLFSREHVLAQRLKELFFKYKRRAEVNSLSRCKGRLEALRRTRDSVITAMKESGDHYRDVLLRYEDDIKEVRLIRNHEGRVDKELVSRILMTWKDLKQLRETQEYRNTDIKLHVKKKLPEDISAEKRIWDGEIRKEVKEIYEELKRKHDEEMVAFKEKHEDWKLSRRKKVKRERIRTESGDSIGITSDKEISEDSETDESSAEEPSPPKMPSLSDIRNEVIETFGKCFRQPGEPELEFALAVMDDNEFNPCGNKEQQRRSAVKRQNIFLKLFYNGKEVCRSKSQPLTQKFNVIISQRFAIRILEWPESLMIEIHEDSGSFAKNMMVSDIFLPFPSCFTTVENTEIQKIEFSSNVTSSYNHTGVGSGNNIIPYSDGSDYNNRASCLLTSGTISYRIGWAENQGQILTLPEKYWSGKREDTSLSLTEMVALEGPFNMRNLKEWTKKSKLDPNDPKNSSLYHILQQARDCESSEILYFRLDPLQEEYNFCSENDIADNPRFKLLNLRDLGELEFRGIKMVPLSDKQIHKDIFRMYEKRISTPQQSLEISSDPLEGHRLWGKRYLEQVRQRVLKECRLARQHKKFHDVVSEESVPDLGTLGLTFMKWLQPKRPLRPVRKERKRITPQNLSGQDIKIIVNVVRAFEVPVRKDVDSLSTSGSNDGFSLVNVRPFVEVSFQGVKARTTAADGANPTWNQDLQIPLRIKNGNFSPASLQSIKDKLFLHLFDEIVVDLIDDETQRETSIHQRFERHWLASMEMPFSTLYFNSRIEGTFKLYSPPVLLGYEREAHRRQFSGSTSQEPLLPQRDATYISLFVTVQPPLNPPELLQEKLESSETSSLEKHLEGWQKEVADMFSHRKMKTLVMDIRGKTICIIRFIKPLCPPRLLSDTETTPEMAARFVAMIPSIAGSNFFPGLFDIWLTADQILRLLSGNSEDHALLLCAYFLHLGLKAYVILGSGIPHGSTAYVLVKESSEKSNDYYVWDATSGQKYNINDSFCPLQKIYCLFNDENIWANIQQEEMPRRTRFDLTKRTDWFPAFGRSLAAPVGSVQPDSLVYRNTSRQAVDILQDKMEKRLRDNIMKWRKTKRTRWNRYCSGTLRKLLPRLEESTWNVKELQTPDHIMELQHILASHKMCGFPINMAYTDMDAVIEAVKATGVHCNESEEVEFAISVYIHSYPNDVLSVWIYVASLVRRR